MSASLEEMKRSVLRDLGNAENEAGADAGMLSSPIAQSNFHLQRANVYAILMLAESIQEVIEIMKKGNPHVAKKPTKGV